MNTRTWTARLLLLLTLGAAAGAVAGEADDLYREARVRLREAHYAEAARLYNEAARTYEEDASRSRAMYWAAFALYKDGGRDELYDAASILQELWETYPELASEGDAGALAARIEGELARRGDRRAAERMAVLAERLEREVGRIEGSREEAERAREMAALDRERRETPAPPGAPMAPEPVEPPSYAGQEPGIPYAPRATDRDEELRIAALNALMQSDPERALPILRKVLDSPDKYSVDMRKKAVFVVAQQGSQGEVEEILLHTVHEDPSPEVRADAVFWLSQVNSDTSLEALVDILNSTDDPEIREKAIFAISQHGSERTADILMDFAKSDGDPEAREQAIFWISQTGSHRALPSLIELYGTIDDVDLRNRILFAVSQSGSREASDWLLARATDSSENGEIRKQALFWAGQHGAVHAEDLRTIYRTTKDPEMKEQVVFVVSQMGCDGLPVLKEIARGDKDPEMREKAVFWIGQSGCPGAASFLEELIGN